MLHDVAPMVDIRSEFERVRDVKASGKVGPHGIFSNRNRYGSCQKAVTVELKSHGTMYRKELMSKPGTRLS